jgi:putative transposase
LAGLPLHVLREAEAGSPIKAVCAAHNISTATYHAWKRKFGGMEVGEAKRLRALEEENSRIKRLVAEVLRGEAKYLRVGKLYSQIELNLSP